MQVKYHVGQIPIKGKGVIADEFIPKGTVIWDPDQSKYVKFDNRKDLIAYIDAADEEWKKVVLNKIFAIQDIVLMPLDDIMYTNHSLESNMIFSKIRTTAIKDIQPGEEIVINYLHLDILDWFEEFLKEIGETLTHDVSKYV